MPPLGEKRLGNMLRKNQKAKASVTRKAPLPPKTTRRRAIHAALSSTIHAVNIRIILRTIILSHPFPFGVASVILRRCSDETMLMITRITRES